MINRTLVLLVFSFSFLPFALLLVYEILGISLCHLAKQKPKTVYLNFPFLVDRQLRTFFLHTDNVKNYEFRRKKIWPGIQIVHRISFLDDVFFFIDILILLIVFLQNTHISIL